MLGFVVTDFTCFSLFQKVLFYELERRILGLRNMMNLLTSVFADDFLFSLVVSVARRYFFLTYFQF